MPDDGRTEVGMGRGNLASQGRAFQSLGAATEKALSFVLAELFLEEVVELKEEPPQRS